MLGRLNTFFKLTIKGFFVTGDTTTCNQNIQCYDITTAFCSHPGEKNPFFSNSLFPSRPFCCQNKLIARLLLDVLQVNIETVSFTLSLSHALNRWREHVQKHFLGQTDDTLKITHTQLAVSPEKKKGSIWRKT